MNTTSERGTEVAAYLAQVRAALADLPPQTRDQLIDDVPEHLAEVAAAGTGPLEAQLGPPAEFAAELRAAAGLAPRAERVAPDRDAIGDAIRAVGRTIAAILGYPGGLAEAGRAFAPAWWALRGVFVAFIAAYVIRPGYGYGEFVYYDMPVGLAFLMFGGLGAVISLRVGQAIAKGPASMRVLSAIASLAVVVVVIYLSSFRYFFGF